MNTRIDEIDVNDEGYGAYIEGRNARRQGIPREGNIYKNDPVWASQWSRGWDVENTAQRLLRAQ